MNTPKIAYKWRRIEDLPDGFIQIANPEIRALAGIWKEQRDNLDTEALREFNDRIRRKWAIETGVIEQVYTIDRGVTQLLIERGFDSSLIPHGSTDRPAELVISMIRDHETAVQELFDFVIGNRRLSTAYIKELHALLTRHQETTTGVNSLGKTCEVPLIRGEYKKLPNNPVRPDNTIHEYCPPEHVASEMDRLVNIYLEQTRDIPPEIQAAWLHHRFSQIHPFQDGNGRVARCLATLVFLQAGWFPLTITRNERERYISALEVADYGDLKPLVDLSSNVEKKAFIQALGIASQVEQKRRISSIVVDAAMLINKRQKALQKEWDKAKELANELHQEVQDKLEEVAGKLAKEVGTLDQRFSFFVDSEDSNKDRWHYFRWQLIKAAKQLDYFVNLRIYHSWVRLVMKTADQTEILFSIHGLGREFRGILGCSAIFYRREMTEEDEREVVDVTPLNSDLFQINYQEDINSSKQRFKSWMDEALVMGLEIWRKSL